MVEHTLSLRKEGSVLTSYTVGPNGLHVGRSSESNVNLADSMVSREHACFWVENDALYVKDLKSRNGTFVNGNRVEQTALQIGDEVTIGNHVLVVGSASPCDAIIDTESLITYEKGSTIVERMVEEGGGGRLPILYKAAQLLGTVFDPDDLLAQMLRLVFEAFNVRRGFILTLSPTDGSPQIRASLPIETSSQGPPLSRTLIKHVFTEKNAVLTLNAQEDARFPGAESMVGHRIRSAMCAPLCGGSSIVGAIYVDSGEETIVYQDDDLELFTAIGRVVGVAIENANLHQEKMENERLAAIGEATAGIGHCVKNFLVGIKGGGEFVDQGLAQSDWDWIKKGWPLVRRAAERIEDLVLNLLSYSRDTKPTIEPARIELIAGEVLDMVRQRAERHKIALEIEQSDIGTVYVDSRDIFRVILNLVNNAIDACEETGGTVKVVLKKDAKGCSIEVADTGPGIPPEMRDRLFKAFASTKGSKGTGLGLACSQRIVEAHGGEISVESTPGKGASFTVFLPSQTALPSRTQSRSTQVSDKKPGPYRST